MLLLSLLLFVSPLLAEPERPKVGLVLSGGGARGAAHVGVIRILERLGVPVDLVVGTSMGAIVGGLYATGMSADELDRSIRAIDWEDIFDDAPPRAERPFRRKQDDAGFLVDYRLSIADGSVRLPRGVILGQKLNLALRGLARRAPGRIDFDDLHIPYRAVATDIETGEAVVLGNGSLAGAMRASMSVPGVFPPVELDGRLLVDGGLANNTPVDVARQMGAQRLIVVDVGSQPRPREAIGSVVEVFEQSLTLMVQREARRQMLGLQPGDIVIVPDLGDIGATEFTRALEAIEAGETAAGGFTVELLAMAGVSRPRGTALRQYRDDDPGSWPRITSVTLVNDTPIDDEVIARRVRLRPGERLDIEQLEQDIAAIYGLGYFETVDYRLTAGQPDRGLEIQAREKSVGLNNLRLGLNLESNLADESDFNIGIAYESLAVNRLGGEWRSELIFGDDLRLSSEFHQPLDLDLEWFVAPRVEYQESNVFLFDEGRRLAEFRLSSTSFGLDVGRTIGTCCEVRVGLRSGQGSTRQITGLVDLPSQSFDIGAYFAQIGYDTLDDTAFPRRGHRAVAAITEANADLGDDSGTRTAQIVGLSTRSWGGDTWVGLLSLNLNASSDDAQVQDLFAAGGFLNLSGFSPGELTGANTALAALIYYRRIAALGGAFPVYAGGSLEYGGVYEDDSDIFKDGSQYAGSLLLAADTPIGPLYLALGMAEGGTRSAYLYLGQTF